VTEVILGCGHGWLVSPELTADPLLCLTCCTAQPVLARFDNVTSGRAARIIGGQLIIETVEAR
jgi:hypothetical protein